MKYAITLILAIIAVVEIADGQQRRFAELVGPINIGPVKNSQTIELPYLAWGGDVAFFMANGNSIDTQTNSIYAKHGLKIKCVDGNDFVAQVKQYLAGDRPLLRGTTAQIGLASELIGVDPRTKPVMFLQLTYSMGDHLVSRSNFKNLNDIKNNKTKKFTVALQRGGPHEGLLYELLTILEMTKNDIGIIYTNDLSGSNGPAEAFRKNKDIDACFVITPDMLGLTGGLSEIGGTAEGNVSGAKVLVSTQTMNRVVADVLCCRRDWYDANKSTVEKITAGYLTACVSLVDERKKFETGKKLLPTYKTILSASQKIFGAELLPTLEVDAHGLLLDAVFVGLEGNISFFEDKGNLSGFDNKTKSAIDMAVAFGDANNRYGFDPSGLDYVRIAKLAGLEYKRPTVRSDRIVGESLDLFPNDDVKNTGIFSFDIHFDVEQSTFNADRYGTEFKKAIELLSKAGNAAIVIRGHADPTKTLVDFIRAGMDKGIITRTGNKGSYTYYINGQKFDLTQTKTVIDLINKGSFDSSASSPRQTLQAAEFLSKSRAEAVKLAIINYAKNKFNLDSSQLQPIGVGIVEPIVPCPKNEGEVHQNMRVEFRLIPVSAEAVKAADFDY